MPKGDVILSYAAAPPRRRRVLSLLTRHFHVWLLPLVLLPGAWESRAHYGDEYIAFAMSQLPSGIILWPLVKLFGQPDLPAHQLFLIVIAAGLVLWACAGWLLDRLRAWKSVYLIMPFAFVAIVTSRLAVPGHVPPIDDYPGQEWEWDAVFVAYCWAVYAVALATLVGAGAVAAGRACVRWARRAAPSM